MTSTSALTAQSTTGNPNAGTVVCRERFDMVTRWSYTENCEVDLTPDDYTFYEDDEDEE